MIKLDEIGSFGGGDAADLGSLGTRGRLAQSWWAQRVTAIIESAAAKPAFDHGRRYARKGQVISLLIEPGKMHARVQGTQSEPYVCRLTATPLTETQWQPILSQMVLSSAYFSALLANQMPTDLEKLFEGAGAELFPASMSNMTCACSCDDEFPPCKHIVAAWCLFADQLDTDPALLLKWHGKEQHEFLSTLRRSWGAPDELSDEEDEQETCFEDMEITNFYTLPGKLKSCASMPPAEEYPNVMKRLGFPPFFPPGDRSVQQVLNNLYDES